VDQFLAFKEVGINLYLVGDRSAQEPQLIAQVRGSFGPELPRRGILEFRIPAEWLLKVEPRILSRFQPMTAEEIVYGSAQANDLGRLQ